MSPGKTAAVAKHGKRVALEVVGWTLVLAGIAALVLPGPGLLGIFAGLLILSQQYEWAERRVEPVKQRALEGASDAVQTWPRITLACIGGLVIVAAGVLWLAPAFRAVLVVHRRQVVALRRMGAGHHARAVRAVRAGHDRLQLPPLPRLAVRAGAVR